MLATWVPTNHERKRAKPERTSERRRTRERTRDITSQYSDRRRQTDKQTNNQSKTNKQTDKHIRMAGVPVPVPLPVPEASCLHAPQTSRAQLLGSSFFILGGRVRESVVRLRPPQRGKIWSSPNHGLGKFNNR